ncbi:MAG: helix-turn-helix domain-containing protein [Rubricoccaceae bacterium]
MPAPPRSDCPIAMSLDILGDRWTLVVMRDILVGLRHSFSEIGAGEGIATNVLSERLERLVETGIVERQKDPLDGRRRIYLPTERGIALIPVLLELVVWGTAHTSSDILTDLVTSIQADRDAVIAEFTSRARESRTANSV